MSQERELKFRLDPTLHDAVRQHPVLLTLGEWPQVVFMQTWYFDTPEHTLRQAGLALRVRHLPDGRRILTLKSSPAQGLQLARGEWEFPIDADAPEADALQRLDHTPLAQLGEAQTLAAQLRAVLGTRVQRTVWQMTWQGTRLEVCLDHGEALGGTGADAPSLPLSELEIELVEGHWPHAFDLAWTLAQDLPLLLSPISKVQTAARAAGLFTLALPPLARELAPQPHGGQAVADVLQQATAVIAVGAEMLQAEPRAETIHQMRLQLRRLRVLLQLLQTTGPQTGRAACRWLRSEWRWAGQLLGHVRDVDVCLDHAAALPGAGEDHVSVLRQLEHRRDARLQPLLAYLRSPRFGRVLLAQARWADDWAGGRITQADESADRLVRRLLRFHRDDLHLHPQRWAELLAIWDGQSAAPLDAPWPALHTLRLKAKQLRYALEWFAPWIDATLDHQGRAWLKLTSALQSDLGEALDTLRLARWLIETAASSPQPSTALQDAGARQAFDQARSGLERALQAARNVD
ncbi:CYTH and CHAD domain-containing protein [Thiomonas bhubaneswarensis]|uniref:Inorganic triphosphatase YgiF, contains CYTH and CHAD domains n=1 Tax=Thiomonas bhubaneswarensis TaxID=339866 RepID=A0A0K6HXI7_9BURK|nr:CYTH and CHAD domain-containing protein [Thiomonas bhubaneswarensis]CUA95533.1 Inorganic triphosphatase YgiF, contains CYTH and CHAD domains [Thiomonas bhubaneswarensis]